MRKNIIRQNYLEKTPVRASHISWSADDDKMVTLELENKGLFNRIAQKLFKKPRVSYIHLDKTGSIVWPLIDGERDIITLGELLKAELGDEAEPLYERLAKFFQVLESYGFVTLN